MFPWREADLSVGKTSFKLLAQFKQQFSGKVPYPILYPSSGLKKTRLVTYYGSFYRLLEAGHQ